MALIALKCPNCNGDIQLDNKNEFGFCMYCGCKVMIENTSKVTLDRTDEFNNLLQISKEELIQHHWEKAMGLVDRAIMIDPKCSDLWLMKALLSKASNDNDAFNRCLEKSKSPDFVSKGIFTIDDDETIWGIPVTILSGLKSKIKLQVDMKDVYEMVPGQKCELGLTSGNHIFDIHYVFHSKTGPHDSIFRIEMIITEKCSLEIKKGSWKLFKIVPL